MLGVIFILFVLLTIVEHYNTKLVHTNDIYIFTEQLLLLQYLPICYFEGGGGGGVPEAFCGCEATSNFFRLF